MSLMRLLTSGKSLIGLANVESRYRMRSGYLLPKFGSTKNPFAAPATIAPDATPAPAVQQLSPAEIAAANLKETKRLPSAGLSGTPLPNTTLPDTVTVPCHEPAPGAKKTSPVAGLLELLSGAMAKVRLPGRSGRAEPKPAIPRFNEQPPVQAELSLDNIRVLRNDLSDADVEVVPARPAAKVNATNASPVAAVKRKRELAETQST